ncbi:MAG TPA: hypothetical protein VMX38_16565 [Verrucomicrobiae bacterium]|nr:hypothetical protein [Verrucomicrobiae bacterium]
MAAIDPEQERRRLAELYESFTQAELEKVALKAYELSELAREVLREVIDKHGLNFRLAEFPTVDEFELRSRVAVRRFRDLSPALLAKSNFDSAQIDCQLVDDNVVRMDWLWSNAIGGIKLLVDVEDADAAEEILAQPIPERFEVSGLRDCEQPHCPNCESLDVNFQELAPAAYVSLYFLPIPFQRRAWRCRSCGTDWEDEAQPDDQTKSLG